MKLSEAIVTASTTAFVLTIVYVYGVTLSIKVDLFTYFGINDYLKISIAWLLPVVFGGFVGAAMNEFFTRVERGATEEEIILSSPNPKFTKLFRKGVDIGVPIVVIGSAVFLTFLSFYTSIPKIKLYETYIMASPIIWLIFMEWYLREPRIATKYSTMQKLLIVVAPSLLLIAFFLGLHKGESALSLSNQEPMEVIEFISKNSTVEGKVIFTFTNYLLFHEMATKKMVIYPNSQIKSISIGSKNSKST